MALRRPHPRPESGGPPAISAWAFAVLVLAVYVPLLRSDLTVFDLNAASRDAAAGFRSPVATVPATPFPAIVPRIAGILLHGLNAALVYLAGRRLLGEGTSAFLAAALFALHPVHVDAVARVRAIPELLGSACLLAGIWAALRFCRLLGGRAAWLTAAGLVSSVLTYTLARAEWQDPSLVGNPLLDAPAGVRFMTAVDVFGRYLKLMIWPYRLSPDYSYNSVPVVSNPLSQAFLLPLAAVVACAAAAALQSRRRPLYGLAGLFFLVSAFPVWHLIDPRVPIMAERFVYLPSAAFCWSVAQLFRDAGWLARPDWRSARSVKSLALLAVCLLVPWATKTFIRARQWSDEKTLLVAAAKTVPDSAQVQLLLGNVHLREGNWPAAQRAYRRALGIYPQYGAAAVHLAAAYRESGQYADALAALQKAAPLDARLQAERFAELGRVHLAQNDLSAAAADYESALARDDSDARVHLELGTLYLQLLGQPDRGRLHLRRSLDLDPAQPRAGEIREVLNRR